MTASALTVEPSSTRWSAVLLIVCAGIVTALQVGKAAIAAPLLQSDLGIGLAAIGWLTGIFAVLGLAGGIPTGALVASFGGRRLLIMGLLTTVFGAGFGAVVSGLSGLLLARVVEGAGFLLVTVAAPSILSQVAKPSDRDVAFALWSCFMPVGMAIAMLTGPMFDDWRTIWWASCLLTLIICLLVPLMVPVDDEHRPWSWRKLKTDTMSVFHARVPVALAGMLALYSLMFFALFSFLPVLLMEQMDVSHQTAGLLSALASAVNVLGNLAAGLLLSRGVSRAVLLAGASITMGVVSFGIFLPLLPAAATFALCMLFSAVGGLIPATILSSAPIVAPTAGLVPVVLGLIIQGNNLGQILGPTAVGSAIERFGWSSAAYAVAGAALVATALVAAFGKRIKQMPE
ncbi:putative 3-hydroxyphenylpropionic transporter MhpT (plasmid) [Labrenzia sp. THAF191b]|uniref:MFS transporter n=1 Tax=unclassified Labrenzia TaxID=2648686 RepID=UPI00126926F8|nr:MULTISPECIES: MFS transporter [unclassified Labrenzia]QFT01605.1 putative 3-hydroxyphenylpropionic transporter MhpT [Labrenzia sp. THAF191b]QFT07810.1 putative 3-hydroxyphenylpropionic transporter MhpT [Labrenzia sp. THAF191a]QFT19324.1 putative 3-hydroxyphenylpropionic transporter MhpT [Labrenzia sp. THAF187b]